MKKLSVICLMIFILTLTCSMALATGKTVTKSITAQNTWSDQIAPIRTNEHGYMNVSISGTWVATVTLQRTFDSGSTWVDVETKTANYEGYLVDLQRGIRYRIGVTTGDYTSGTVILRLSN